MDITQRVLIVDDSQIMRRIINSFLQRMGFSAIVEATNGKNALRIIADSEIDLIISDWSMQGTTGIDVLEAVRREKKTRNIPFIMITAEAQLFHILKAFRAEVNQYLVKPFSFEQFEYTIKKF